MPQDLQSKKTTVKLEQKIVKTLVKILKMIINNIDKKVVTNIDEQLFLKYHKDITDLIKLAQETKNEMLQQKIPLWNATMMLLKHLVIEKDIFKKWQILIKINDSELLASSFKTEKKLVFTNKKEFRKIAILVFNGANKLVLEWFMSSLDGGWNSTSRIDILKEFLMTAIAKNNVEVIAFLFKSKYIKLDIIKNNCDWEILKTAFMNANDEVIKTLLAVNFDFSHSLSPEVFEKLQPLMEDVAIAEKLLASGMPVDITENTGTTFLFYAAHINNQALAKLLLERGANVNHVNCVFKDGQIFKFNALHMAIINNSIEVISLLYKYDNEIFSRILPNGLSPLILAITKNIEKAVDIIITNAPDTVNQQVKKNAITPLLCAVKNKNLAIVEKIITINPDLVNSFDTKGSQTTILMVAIETGEFAIIKSLIEKGANVNAINSSFNTVLMLAIFNFASDKTYQLLKKYGADLTFINKKGISAYLVAVTINNKNAQDFFIEHNINLETCCQQTGDTILTKAVSDHKNLRFVKSLLKNHNVDVNHANEKNGNTAIMITVSKNDVALTQEILKYNPNLNIKNKNGQTVMNLLTNDKSIEIRNLFLARQNNESFGANKKNDDLQVIKHSPVTIFSTDVTVPFTDDNSNSSQIIRMHHKQFKNSDNNKSPNKKAKNSEQKISIVGKIPLKSKLVTPETTTHSNKGARPKTNGQPNVAKIISYQIDYDKKRSKEAAIYSEQQARKKAAEAAQAKIKRELLVDDNCLLVPENDSMLISNLVDFNVSKENSLIIADCRQKIVKDNYIKKKIYRLHRSDKQDHIDGRTAIVIKFAKNDDNVTMNNKVLVLYGCSQKTWENKRKRQNINYKYIKLQLQPDEYSYFYKFVVVDKDKCQNQWITSYILTLDDMQQIANIMSINCLALFFPKILVPSIVLSPKIAQSETKPIAGSGEQFFDTIKPQLSLATIKATHQKIAELTITDEEKWKADVNSQANAQSSSGTVSNKKLAQ